jgi:PDZ domain-containing protein
MNRPEGDNPAEADEAPPRVVLDKQGPGGVDPPASPPPAAPARRGPLRKVVVGIVVTVVAALVASAFVRVEYYRFAPGGLYATEALVTVKGAPTFTADGGQVDFTTVSSKKASVLDYFLARFDEAVELKPADQIERGHTPEENRQENLEMMVSSKQMAEVAALRKLGYRVDMHGTGALVKALYKDAAGRDLPAASVLKVNDTITAIDGKAVELGEQAVAAISTRRPGDTISLQVESAPGVPGRTETVTLVSRCAAVEAGECPAGDEDKPLLGVRLSNRDTRFDVPLELDIDTKDVGGPSAGLAITLGIIDVLTPGSLTGGGRVATTGTIDADGNVGEVGGILQKTHLVVRQRVPLFLVPEAEAEEAKRYAEGSGTVVVPVKTLDEALAVLRDHGGLTQVVAEEAAARSGGTVAPPGTAN